MRNFDMIYPPEMMNVRPSIIIVMLLFFWS